MRSPSRRPTVSIAVAALVVAGAGSAVAVSRPAQRTVGASVALPAWMHARVDGASTVLTRTVLASLAHATRVGAADPARQLSVTVALVHPDDAGEAALARAIYTPGSPSYHHYLSPAQYDARFGVPAARTDATVAWLRAGGATVESVAGAGDLVNVEASIASLARLFHVDFGAYRLGGRSFVANAQAPTVPTRLGVETVIGLNTFEQVHVPDPMKAVGAHAKAGPHPNVLGLTPNGPFSPQQLWSVYDLPDSNRGSGATAGVFIAGQTAPLISDLRLFEQTNKLPRVPIRVVYGGDPAQTTFNLGADEWDLDTQAVTGMAPDLSSLSYYDAKSFFDADILPTFAKWRDDPNGPLQMNASFGECEQNPLSPVTGQPAINPPLPYGQGLGNVSEVQYEVILRAAAMEGRTLFSSTGDTGSGCGEVAVPGLGAGNGLLVQPVPMQEYPADSPWAVAVGGTDIETTDDTFTHRKLEYTEPTAGGGSSYFLAQQPWMKPVTTMAVPCAVDETGTPYAPGTTCRGVPDVAALYGGQLAAGYNVFSNHIEVPAGGTSLSSPLNVGMWARVQAAAPTPAGLGFAQAEIYKLGTGPTAASDFYDVTVGANGFFTALPGWDYTSGFGVIDVAHFMKDATGNLTPQRPKAQAKVADPTHDACKPLFTTAAGNTDDVLSLPSFTKDPSLDLTKGTVTTSADGKSLVVTLSGPTLSPDLETNVKPFGADFSLIWEYKGVLYYAKATVAAVSGDVSYDDGTVADLAFNSKASIKGTFADHVLTMTVPVADVGNPKAGALLQWPLGLVDSAELGPVFLAIGIDAGADQDYVVGSACSSGKTVVKKPVKKPHHTVSGTKVTKPSGSLAATGVPAALGLVALLATGAGLAIRRRAAGRD
ncbi:MAG TPA: S53 family peptidase [Mycobacteriales bacterium]|nr:S53 family peptidase [Mycobacteriales bacterium]